MHSWHNNRSSKSDQRHSSRNKEESRYRESYRRSSNERPRSSRSHIKNDQSRMEHNRRKDSVAESSSMHKGEQDLFKMEKYLKGLKSDFPQQSKQGVSLAQERSSQLKEESTLQKSSSHLASNRVKPVGTVPPPSKSKGSSRTKTEDFHQNAVSPASGDVRYSYPDEQRVTSKKNRSSDVEHRTIKRGKVHRQEIAMIRTAKKSEAVSQAFDDRLKGLSFSSDSMSSDLHYYDSTNFNSPSQRKYDLLSSTRIQDLESQKEDETSYSWVGEFLDDETDDYVTNKTSRAQKAEHQHSDNVSAKKERRHSRRLYDEEHSLAQLNNQSKPGAEKPNSSFKFELESRYGNPASNSVKLLLNEQNKQATLEHPIILKGGSKTSSSLHENTKLNSSKERLARYGEGGISRRESANSQNIKRQKTDDYCKNISQETKFSGRSSEATFSRSERKEHTHYGQNTGEESIEHLSHKRPFLEDTPARHQLINTSDSRYVPLYHSEKVNYVAEDAKCLNRDSRQFDRTHWDQMQGDNFSPKRHAFEPEYRTEFAEKSELIKESHATYETNKKFHKALSSINKSPETPAKLRDAKGRHDFSFDGQKQTSSNYERLNDPKGEDSYLHRRFEKRRVIDQHDEFSACNEREHKYFHHDRFDNLKSNKADSTASRQSASSNSPHSMHRKSDKVSVSDFSGAWKAATNTSINVEYDPKLYQHNAKELVFALNAVKTPAEYSSKHQSKQQKVSGDDAASTLSNQRSDKREVLCKSKRESLDRYDPVMPSEELTHKRLVISKKSSTKQTSDSRNVEQQPLSRNVISSSDYGGSITIRKQIPPNDREFWEKDFVDWFSKHILPTQAFKVYMECVCPRMTSSDLAAMPMDFLEHLQDGDHLAINCIPKNKSESRKLFTFLGKFRELEDVDKETNTGMLYKSHEILDKKVRSNSSYSTSQHHKVPPMDTRDANIPVLISGNTLPNEQVSQRSVLPVSNVENDPDVLPLAPEHNVQNLIITCNNPEPNFGQKPFVHSLSRTVVNEVFQPSIQSHRQDQSTAVFTETSVESGVGNTAFGRSDLVNPRWNAEVQDFIGRAQSAKSRPCYVEYLEKSHLDVKDSDDFSGSSHWHKSSPSPRTRSFSPRDSSVIQKHRSRDQISRPSQRDHLLGRSRSPSRDFGRRRDIDSRASRQTSSDRKTTSHSKTRVRGRSPIKGSIKETRSTSDNKSLRVSSSKKSSGSSQSSDLRKLSSSKNETSRRTSSSNVRNSSESRSQKRSIFKVFGALEKRPMVVEQETGKELEKISQKSEFASFKRYLKNYAAQHLNFMYGIEQYDSGKIMKVVKDCRHDFCKHNTSNFGCSVKETIYILKDIFSENSKANIQVNLKRKLSERGKDWAATSFEVFQKWQKEVFEYCHKNLQSSKPYKKQDSASLYDATKHFEQLYPQFCGDVEFILQIWLWKCHLIKNNDQPDANAFGHLEGWSTFTGAKKDVDSFLSKQFNFPVYENSDRKCEAVISAIQSKLKSTKEEAINHILDWWMSGYYKCRYQSFERKMKTTVSTAKQSDDAVQAAGKDKTEDVSTSGRFSEESLVVVDEMNEEEKNGGEKTKILPKDSRDSTDPTLLEYGLEDQEDDVNEYAEDELGCPTILLF